MMSSWDTCYEFLYSNINDWTIKQEEDQSWLKFEFRVLLRTTTIQNKNNKYFVNSTSDNLKRAFSKMDISLEQNVDTFV